MGARRDPLRPRSAPLLVACGLALAALAPALGQAQDLAPLPGPRLVVMLEEGREQVLEAWAMAHGARVLDRWPALGGAVLAPGPAGPGAQAAALRALPWVAAAEPDAAWRLHATPNDPGFVYQWGPASIRAPAAWDHGFGSRAVRVAVLDTGADLDHPDLAPNLCAGRNFVAPGQPPEDDHDHGTHVAGIVAALANNARGVAGTSQSCVLVAKVCDAAGGCAIAEVGAALDWALDPDGDPRTADGAHVASMSFGSLFHATTMQKAMQRAWARGLLLVASAGNAHCSLVDFPAAYDEVVAVGALQRLPAVANLAAQPAGLDPVARAPYSNCGPEVELTAPGTAVYSTVRGAYASLDGTSMATPFVSGVAALAKAANPALTAAQLRCVLDASAQDLGPPGRDLEHGFGKVRADLAVAAAPQGAACAQPQAPLGLWGEDP